MSTSLMDLVQRLVEIESQDAAAVYGADAPVWAGSDNARAALADVEQRIEAIRDAVIIGTNINETVQTLLDGDE